MQPLPRIFLTSAGEIRLPKDLQESLQLHTGTPFLVSVEDNRLCLQPMNRAYFSSLRGSLKEADAALTLEALHEEKQAEQSLEERRIKSFKSLHR